MQPELPEGYYLENVRTLFDHVERLYGDILARPQLDFLQQFAALSTDAKKLYIRLLNRSHDLFRLRKLRYPEIASIPAALAQLEPGGFLRINPDIENGRLLSLFTKTELLAFHPERTRLQNHKRSDIEAYLLDQADDDYFTRLRQSDRLLEVLQKDCYLLCQMLFFGNLNQSMTDFVLRDLGLNQYESYRIDPKNRPYSRRLDIEQHWLLHQLDARLQASDPADTDSLNQCFGAIPDNINPDTAAFRKAERIKYTIARQFERLGDFDQALTGYHQCQLPPGRERIARILDRQGRTATALELCKTIIANPLGEEEAQVVCALGRRIIQRHKLALEPVFEQIHSNHSPAQIELELNQQHSVEQAVVEYFLNLNPANRCYHLENTLFNGVLGLLIWDAVFAPLSGAFYHPFQSCPSDFYAHDFVSKRAFQLSQIWDSIHSNGDIYQRVQACWKTKYGLMNALVNWQALELETIELALERIEYRHWIIIFKRILRDLGNNRSGFPDLVLFPAEGNYRLIEVKGPGDSLQKNQQRWMQYFAEHQIPHALARVRWSINT